MKSHVTSSPRSPRPQGSREALANGMCVLDAGAAAQAAFDPLDARDPCGRALRSAVSRRRRHLPVRRRRACRAERQQRRDV